MDGGFALVNFQTLEAAQFRIKTTLGVSQELYQHCWVFPIHCTGQGSGNLSTIWGFVCSALFDALDFVATGAYFISPDGKHSIQMCMIGFIDDCSQCVNWFSAHPQPTTQELVDIMKQEARLWNDLLWASGDCLEQNKRSFHMVKSSWNARGIPFLVDETDVPQLILTNDQNAQIAIKQLSIYTPHRILGCYIEPTMMMQQQQDILKAKNENCKRIVQTNCFSRAEAWTFSTSTYLPSMTYPFPNIILTESAGKLLHENFMHEMVPRCGYRRSMSSAVRFAPQKLGGAGFWRLYYKWGLMVTLELLKSP